MTRKTGFTLRFSLDNAAFVGDPKSPEIDTILRGVADRAGDGQTGGVVYDSNGNRVGAWWMDEEDKDDD